VAFLPGFSFTEFFDEIAGLVMVKDPINWHLIASGRGRRHGHDADCCVVEYWIFDFRLKILLVIPVLNPRLDRQFLVI
jgi:hypothetical protein